MYKSHIFSLFQNKPMFNLQGFAITHSLHRQIQPTYNLLQCRVLGGNAVIA